MPIGCVGVGRMGDPLCTNFPAAGPQNLAGTYPTTHVSAACRDRLSVRLGDHLLRTAVRMPSDSWNNRCRILIAGRIAETVFGKPVQPE